jgi:hypothetical protein
MEMWCLCQVTKSPVLDHGAVLWMHAGSPYSQILANRVRDAPDWVHRQGAVPGLTIS